jgi:prepilin-type N-terminal cleavage/methylation domain-containing protein
MPKKKVIDLFKFLIITYNNRGYTLVELLSLMAIMGVLAAVAAPQLLNNDAKNTADGRSQIKGLLQQTRGRAVSTTSAIRIKPDPSQPDGKLSIEIADTRGCESLTKLSEDAKDVDNDLKVLSTNGFVEGDLIKVGGDTTANEILAIDKMNSVITLGLPLGSDQSKDSKIELAENWKSDPSFLIDDLTLPKKVALTTNISDWTLCFNSRGIASIYDDQGTTQPELVFTITNTSNSDQETLTVLKGGAIKDD